MSFRNRKPLLWAEVNLDYLRRNLRSLRANLSNPQTEVLAVVKADAYGHGMTAVAETLAGEGVNFFGVANIDEAVALRRVCPQAHILVLGSFHRDQIPLYIRHRIVPTVASFEDVILLDRALSRTKKPFPVHAKIDTGMGRLGIAAREATLFFREVKKMASLFVEGVYTHFSSAGDADRSVTTAQLELFSECVAGIRRMGFAPRYFHAANSMGLAHFANAHLNLVRPGIILYGINPSKCLKLPFSLKPILSLKTRIAFLKEVEKDTPLSYGATYKTPSETRIATLPVGYSHGYRVNFSNKAFVVVRDIKCPVVGRVTMDQTLIDVGRVPAVRRWEEVTLIGGTERARVLAQDLADLADTIPYEILCSLHSRIPRIYKGR